MGLKIINGEDNQALTKEVEDFFKDVDKPEIDLTIEINKKQPRLCQITIFNHKKMQTVFDAEMWQKDVIDLFRLIS